METPRPDGGEQRETILRILHLEDDPLDVKLVGMVIEAEFSGCSVATAATRAEFLAQLGRQPLDLILSDFTLPGFSGRDALALAHEHVPGVPFIFVSGTIGEERAIAALRAGAADYVLKGSLARLPGVIRRALEESAQRRLLEGNARRLRELTSIIERASEAIVVSDMAGRVTLWNDGAARLYGLSAGDAVGRTSEEIFPGTEIPDHIRAAREATLESGEWRRELNITIRDGRRLVVDLHMTLVRDAAGRPCARLSIATDITEKKKLEEKALRAQRLESLGLLAASIAHDFNNVLTPINMAVEMLGRCVSDPADVRMLNVVGACASRGAGLVAQILNFARGVGGEPQLMPPGHLLGEISEHIETSFPKSISFHSEIPDDLWPIRANPTQIHQVLLNLAVNARDAMLPAGGTLRLAAENRLVDEAGALEHEGGRSGRFLVVEISDTGGGIKPDVLARIWEPFFTTKGESSGTGLGLSTVRGIVAAHEGFVTVATQLGLGTTFRVFLPAAPTEVVVG